MVIREHANRPGRPRHGKAAPISPFGSLVIGSLMFVASFFIAPDIAKAGTVSGDIREDATWIIGDSPYIVTGTVTVRGASHGLTATLTIEPGVTVEFATGAGLILGSGSNTYKTYGALRAQGTEAAPITFTSGAADPAPGDWDGIKFSYYTNSSASILEHCIVEYGGRSTNANVWTQSSPAIRNCTIQHSSMYGMYLLGSSSDIRNNTIQHSGGHGMYLDRSSPNIRNNAILQNGETGMYLTGASNPAIGAASEGNVISGNGTYGIFAVDDVPFPAIESNTISGNGSYPVRVGALAPMNNNTFAENGVRAVYLYGEYITADTTWSNDIPTYFVAGDVTVRGPRNSNAATLTIEPGVTIKFSTGGGLTVGASKTSSNSYYKGILSARGTEASPITFTSNAADPAPGDWKGINFHYRTVSANTFLEHCVVEYGGRTNANVYVNATPTIHDCTIQYSGAHGIYLFNSSPSIKGNVIKDNGQAGIFLTRSANPVIGAESAGNVISGNGTYGIFADDYDPIPTIEYNTISHNGSYPVRIGVMVDVSTNTIEGNGVQAVHLYGGNMTAYMTWSDIVPVYIVSGSVTVRGASRGETASLTIDPGVTVKFSSHSGLNIGYAYRSNRYYGILSARGTEASPITFTSNAVEPSPGDWRGINFGYAAKSAQTILERCIVEYGGYSQNANILMQSSKPAIRYNTIRNSSQSGLLVANYISDGVDVSCNNFKDNLYGVSTGNRALPNIRNNNFLRNLHHGVYNNGGTSAVNATNNWWGDPAGPGHGGDSVQGVVNVTPWLEAESGCIAAPPLNNAPYPPRVLGPEDNATDVPATPGGQPGDLALAWAGGDPNPFDAVAYDLYLGDSEYSLARVAGGLIDKSRLMAGLAEGRTYFWQVVARDDMGEEIVGPVWRFTTLSSDPDHTPPSVSKCDGPRSGAGPGNRACD